MQFRPYGWNAIWVLRRFPEPLRVCGRLGLVGDGIEAPKRGKKMPAVKLLHQESESSTKPEYIMGHSLQAVSVLVQAAKSVFAVLLVNDRPNGHPHSRRPGVVQVGQAHLAR
jgi:hypothetical protein